MIVLSRRTSSNYRIFQALFLFTLMSNAFACSSEDQSKGSPKKEVKDEENSDRWSDEGGGGSSASLSEGGTGAGEEGTGSSSAHESNGGGGGTTLSAAPRLSEFCTVFPSDNSWNLDVSELSVHENSANYVASVGVDTRMHPDFGTEWEGAPIGIPFVLVEANQDSVHINYTAYGDESDPGPFAIPLDAPIEGGADADGDRHVIAVDSESCTLYELYAAEPTMEGWDAESGAQWDLNVNDTHPVGCTSADAAGLPIFPGLVRYDEVVEKGSIEHALRFTVENSQKAYIFPATHYASSKTDTNLPPMGLRFRMRASYDCSGFSDEVQVICTALKKYGMIVADNGANWYLSGAPDSRWNDDNLGDLKKILGNAFEVVDTGSPIITSSPDCSL